ncbi:Outer membrane protein beta-barrel domain-containing protein [Dyadobacter sp. SG02]|nr:Outer membrane protein beta-barrel domain-containing protein [Dyadobacter sp. SG02]
MIMIAVVQTNVFGQSVAEPRRWHFGAMLGPQFSWLVPKVSYGDQTGGIMAALDVSYAFQNSAKGWSLHLQPGINRFKSRQVYGKEGTDYYMKWNWKSMNINLPLLVRYTILEGKIRPFAEIGASYWVRNYWKVKGTGQTCLNGQCSPNDFDDKGNSEAEKGKFSGLGGVGVEFDLGKVTVPVTVRWIEQLKKVERFREPTIGLDYTIPRSRGLMVSVGVTF